MQSTLNEPDSENAWTQIAPLLSTALAQLGEKDQDAIVLRFFDGKNMNEIGAALGVSENTAKTRVSRAVEKMRKFFMQRGVVLSATAIVGAISANSIQAAPIGLAASVTVAAAKGTVVATSTLTLIKGALELMAWSKTKTTVIVGAGILLLGGGVTTWVLKTKAGADFAKDPVASQFRNQSPSQVDANEVRQQLVGNWVLKTKRLGMDKDYIHYKDNNRQKMWTLTNWAIVRYGDRSNIIYSASGPYELQGDLYTETVEKATGIMTNYLGGRMEFRLRVDGDKYYQTGLGDQPGLQEIGRRLPQ
jgi:hypothetical protein